MKIEFHIIEFQNKAYPYIVWEMRQSAQNFGERDKTPFWPSKIPKVWYIIYIYIYIYRMTELNAYVYSNGTPSRWFDNYLVYQSFGNFTL